VVPGNAGLGVLIEPNPHHCKLLREQRPKSQVSQVADGARNGTDEVALQIAGGPAKGHSVVVSALEQEKSRGGGEAIRVKLRSLDQVIQESGIPKIDFLSIDVEGMEMEVLESLSFSKYPPRLISIEDFCEDFEKKRFMRRVGYKLIRRVGYNNWYVPRHEPASVFSVSTPRELLRLIRKDFLSVPFMKVRKAVKRLKRKT
jgi:FkbM family methyltransferase